MDDATARPWSADVLADKAVAAQRLAEDLATRGGGDRFLGGEHSEPDSALEGRG